MGAELSLSVPYGVHDALAFGIIKSKAHLSFRPLTGYRMHVSLSVCTVLLSSFRPLSGHRMHLNKIANDEEYMEFPSPHGA